MITQQDRAFLDFFQPLRRSYVANLFLRPVRQGIVDPLRVYAAVFAELRDNIDRAHQWGRENGRDQGILDQMRRSYDEALDYARYAVEYEKLSPEQKQRLKDGRAGDAILGHMDREEPTERQREYLARKGYVGPIYSKKFASSLIDVYTRGGRVDMSGAI
jgi:hypothetical protein